MATNREVITAALRMLSVLDADQTSPSSEDGALCLTEMNDLMASLAVDGIDLGFPPQDNLADDFPLDATVEAQIKPLLAMWLYPYYPAASLPEALPGRAERSKSQLLRSAVLSNMEKSSVTHAPLGERSAWVYDIASDS